MDYATLGSTRMDVSRICLGCMGFGDAERWIHKWVLDEENSRPSIKKALECRKGSGLVPSRAGAFSRSKSWHSFAASSGLVSVATHWERAGRVDRAVEWAVRAADAARAAAAYDDASRYLLSALRAIDPMAHGVGDAVADLDRAELLLELARVQYLGGSLEASVESCEQAATQGERAGRPDVIARAAIIVQGVGHPAINLRLERLCRRALELNDAGGPQHLQARVEAQLACTLYESDGFDEAGRWSSAALSHAAASGDPDAELDAIRARAALVSVPGFSQEMLELGRRAAQLAGPTRRPLAEGRCGGPTRRSTSGTWLRHRGSWTTSEPWPTGPVFLWCAGTGYVV